MLSVSEIFRSIQGESSFAGLPCVFVRLAGCNLACAYCDSQYARQEPGVNLEIDEILEQVNALGGGLVEVTGGEPLIQVAAPQLLTELAATGRTVLVETNGSIELPAERRYHVIMDMKTPSSGEMCSHHEKNPGLLTGKDEVKFVISDRSDFDWALDQIAKNDFAGRGITILISPAYGRCSLADLSAWILETGLPLRLQLQLQKVVWPGVERGR